MWSFAYKHAVVKDYKMTTQNGSTSCTVIKYFEKCSKKDTTWRLKCKHWSTMSITHETRQRVLMAQIQSDAPKCKLCINPNVFHTFLTFHTWKSGSFKELGFLSKNFVKEFPEVFKTNSGLHQELISKGLRFWFALHTKYWSEIGSNLTKTLKILYWKVI